MPLNPQQIQVAKQLYQLALSKRLPEPRAREFVAAAFAESGLNPQAHNPSGASGLFQLLSPGYQSKAKQMGGLFNPAANANAILPDYLKYWARNPNAAAGAAARDVERSGQGAGFYAKPLGLLGSLAPQNPTPTVTMPRSAPMVPRPPVVRPAKPQTTNLLPLLKILGLGDIPGIAQLAQFQTPPRLLPGVAAQRPLPGPPHASNPRLGGPLNPPTVTRPTTKGSVIIRAGADRPGVTIKKPVVAFVRQISAVYGKPLTIGTGTNHNQYVVNTHRESDHWTGWAADIPASGVQLTRLGQSALIAAGADPAWARRQTGGVYNIGGKQILFNTNVGGNHYNHLHVGIRAR